MEKHCGIPYSKDKYIYKNLLFNLKNILKSVIIKSNLYIFSLFSIYLS